jgi:hypothetical protein
MVAASAPPPPISSAPASPAESNPIRFFTVPLLRSKEAVLPHSMPGRTACLVSRGGQHGNRRRDGMDIADAKIGGQQH